MSPTSMTHQSVRRFKRWRGIRLMRGVHMVVELSSVVIGGPEGHQHVEVV
jgi:hypothetical protein